MISYRMRRILPVLLLSIALGFLATATSAQTSEPVAPKKKTEKKHKMTDTVGVVNGQVILLYDYRGILSDMIRQAARDSAVKNGAVTPAQLTDFVNAAWDKTVEDIIVEQEIYKRKLNLSDAETKARILKTPPPFLVQQFTDSMGKFRPDVMQQALNDPLNDSITHIIISVEKINLEHEALLAAIAQDVKSDEAKITRFNLWLKKQKLKARIDDRRVAFGYY
jgi:hypothetical protein